VAKSKKLMDIFINLIYKNKKEFYLNYEDIVEQLISKFRSSEDFNLIEINDFEMFKGAKVAKDSIVCDKS
jgi:hypothetical protein